MGTANYTDDVEKYWYWNEDNSPRDGTGLELSVDIIVRQLVHDSKARLTNKEETKCQAEDSNEDYWEWKTHENMSNPTSEEEPSKDELLKIILLEEEIRQSMMVER